MVEFKFVHPGPAPDDLSVGVRQQFLLFGGHPLPVTDMAAEQDWKLMLRAIGIVQPDSGNLLAFDFRPLRQVQQVEFLELAPHRDADEVGVSWGVALLLRAQLRAIDAPRPCNQERQSIIHLPPNEALPKGIGLAIGNELLLLVLGEVEDKQSRALGLAARLRATSGR